MDDQLQGSTRLREAVGLSKHKQQVLNVVICIES